MELENIANVTAFGKKDGKGTPMKIVLDDKALSLLENGRGEEAQKYVEGVGAHVMFEPQFQIDENYLSYSPHEPKKISKYNTQITIHLPYLLHLPNDLTYDMTTPFRSFVRFKKQWTEKASGSCEADVTTDRKTYIAGKATIESPKYPVDPALGWQTPWTGQNVEKVMDVNGYFRYSIAVVEFDTDFGKEKEKEPSKEIALNVSEKATAIMNRILRIYLDVTEEVHVQPLPSFEVVDIYFSESNIGLMPAMGIGIGTAVMNHAIETVSSFKKQVECDYEPDIVRLLHAKARWAYHIKDYKIAVLESFTSTDVCIEKHLISKHTKGGKTAQEAEDAIKGTSRTRLTNQFSQFHSKQFNKLFPSEYGSWEQLYISVRNPVAHKGRMPTAKEAEDSIIANEKIISCMQSLT